MVSPTLAQMTDAHTHDLATAQLLELLLTDELVYPEPQVTHELYWTEVESAFSVADWSEAELATRSEHFFATLATCWSSHRSRSLQAQLQARFGQLVPTDWLETISDRAQALLEAGLSPLEELVTCVEPLLTNWTIEDLQVFARPVAYAMRSAEAPEAELPTKDWTALSPVEQARLTMQVAQYALKAAQPEVD